MVGSNIVGSTIVGSNSVGSNIVGSEIVGSNIAGSNIVGWLAASGVFGRNLTQYTDALVSPPLVHLARVFFFLLRTIVNDLLAKYNLLNRNFDQLKTLYVVADIVGGSGRSPVP